MNKAVFFDLDNTLVHRNRSIDKFSASFVEYFSDFLATADVNGVAQLIRAVDNGGYGHSDNPFSSIKKSVAHTLVTKLLWRDAPPFNTLLEYWKEYFPRGSVAMTGAEQQIIRLKSLEYSIGVISNGMHCSRVATLQSLNFLDYFDLVLSSEVAGVNKPDATIFEMALSQLNVNAENAWYVGDHLVNDIQGAAHAGLTAIWLEGFDDIDGNNRPQRVIKSLSELKSWIC